MSTYREDISLPQMLAIADVKEGDVIEITFGQKVTKYQVLNVTEYATKESASSMYKEL